MRRYKLQIHNVSYSDFKEFEHCDEALEYAKLMIQNMGTYLVSLVNIESGKVVLHYTFDQEAY